MPLLLPHLTFGLEPVFQFVSLFLAAPQIQVVGALLNGLLCWRLVALRIARGS